MKAFTQKICSACQSAFQPRGAKQAFCTTACRIRGRSLIDPATACWLYQGKLDGWGYAGRMHRISHEAFNGRIPDGEVVRHTCHTPRCLAPYHLTTGTGQQNMDDMVAAGRSPRGVNNHKAKLTDGQVRLILADTSPVDAIAGSYGVHANTIHRIKDGRNWNHITGLPKRR